MNQRQKTSRFVRLATGMCAVTALTLAALPAGTASAAGEQGGQGERLKIQASVQTFKNRATGACLDDSQHGLRPMPCGPPDNPHQRWTVYDKGGNVRVLKNVATGACLDDSNEQGLRAFACGNGTEKYQRWQRRAWPGGIELLNQATGRCLDDSHEGLRTVDCNGGQPYQLWY
ncbi:RICIN domain-containing protein [Streptomyces sp. NPDC021093]|uniref:RICIN domain-containing protein n=1 Tax=Streptomyces sp. NPDC021093 TaxID=3365112 RepID=UPI0037BBDFBC